MSDQLHVPPTLLPGKEPVVLNKKLGGIQSQCRRFEEEKYLLTLPVIEQWFLGHPARSLIATPATASRFLRVLVSH